MDNVSISLPVEILEVIMEYFTSEYSDTNEAGDYKYLPQWYLTPVLRVSKTWNMLAEKRLYQRIAIGMNFSRARKPRTRDRTNPNPESLPLQRYQFSRVAKGLLTTLSAHPHLASLVEELRLGIKDSQHSEAPEWTETHARLIQVCQNLKHVDIQGFALTKRDVLVEALSLKEKANSLASFHINSQGLSGVRLLHHTLYIEESIGLIEVLRRRLNSDAEGLLVADEDPPQQTRPGIVGDQFSLNNLLVVLPDLWALRVAWTPIRTSRTETSISRTRHSEFLDTPLSHCVRTLRGQNDQDYDINFTGRWIRHADLKLLQAITTNSRVRRLDIGIRELTPANLALEALCECLHTWSKTVESIRLNLFTTRHSAYQLLYEALRTQTVLQELELLTHAQLLDLGAMADLPRLERMCVAPQQGISEEDIYNLIQHLQDSKKFRSLRYLAIYPERGVELGKRLEIVCRGRGIKLERWPGEGPRFIPGFVL